MLGACLMSHFRVALLACLIGTVGLVGCGRKSDLETPSAAAAERRKAGEKNVEAPAPREDKRFFLDALID